MNVVQTPLPGVLVIEPRVFADDRGHFFESYHADRYAAAGIGDTFVQDNQSLSVAGTVRGMHYQLLQPQAKLVRVVRGEVFDVAADIRVGSPTFGRWFGVTLSAANRRQLYISAGYAHGFCVTSDVAEVAYKCSALYRADDQRGVVWNDATLAIAWPPGTPVLSAKDATYGPLDPGRDDLPVFR